MESTFSLGEGEIFQGRYWIEKELSRGGMGVVYRAIHLEDGNNVVIKRILAARDESEKAKELQRRFSIEASILKQLHHPGVVQLHDFGHDASGAPFMVMEYIWGDNPAYPFSYLELNAFPLAEAERLFWQRWPGFAQVLDGLLEVLEMLHELEILHRDLKPPNMLLQPTYGGQLVRLIDFGISKTLVRSDKKTRPAMGSPWYISPEQISGEVGQLSARSDLFAVGVMLYRSLCGHYPWQHESAGALMFKRLMEPPAACPPWVPEALKDVALSCLQTDPEARPASARALRESMQTAIQAARPEGVPLLTFPVTLAPQEHPPRPNAAFDATLDGSQEAAFGQVTAGATAAFDDEDLAHHQSSQDASGGQEQASQAPSWTPYSDWCVVVLPEGESYGVDCDAHMEQIKAFMSSLALPTLREPLIVKRVSPSVLEGESADPMWIEAIEYARLVCWGVLPETTPALSRLLHALYPSDQVLLLRLTETPPPAWQHLPLLHLNDEEQLRSSLTRVLQRRWLPLAQARQWQRAAQSRSLLERVFVLLQGEDGDAIAQAYEALCEACPENPRFLSRRAAHLLQRADTPEVWHEVAALLQETTSKIPECAAAWRDLGVAYNKLGEEAQSHRCFVQALHLAPDDYDAIAAYAGSRKTQARRLQSKSEQALREAREGYEKSAILSQGHPYPLLNALRLQATERKSFDWTEEQRTLLTQAIKTRQHHLVLGLELPWSLFDLCEAYLYIGQPQKARALLQEHQVEPSQLKRFLESLEALLDAKIEADGLDAFLHFAHQMMPGSAARPALRMQESGAPVQLVPSPSPWKQRLVGFVCGVAVVFVVMLLYTFLGR